MEFGPLVPEFSSKETYNTQYILPCLRLSMMNETLPLPASPQYVVSTSKPVSLSDSCTTAPDLYSTTRSRGCSATRVPSSQLMLRTGYPYVPPFVPPFRDIESIPSSILDADSITEAEKPSVFTNAKNMFGADIFDPVELTHKRTPSFLNHLDSNAQLHKIMYRIVYYHY